jgi:hypothetical protein
MSPAIKADGAIRSKKRVEQQEGICRTKKHRCTQHQQTLVKHSQIIDYVLNMVEQRRQKRIRRQDHQPPLPFTVNTQSEIDPMMYPATAAVENLPPMPERECKRRRFSGDGAIDNGRTFDLSALARVSVLIKESLAFPLIEWSISDDESSSSMNESFSRAHSFLDKFVLNTSYDRHRRTPESPSSSCSSHVGSRTIRSPSTTDTFNNMLQRRLVRSIALDSRLALLDASTQPSVRGTASAAADGDYSFASSVSIDASSSNRRLPVSVRQDLSLFAPPSAATT